jgi:hypothetical protein
MFDLQKISDFVAKQTIVKAREFQHACDCLAQLLQVTRDTVEVVILTERITRLVKHIDERWRLLPARDFALLFHSKDSTAFPP